MLKSIRNHMILAAIATGSTNIYFLLGFIIIMLNPEDVGSKIFAELSFMSFLLISNCSLLFVIILSSQYAKLGKYLIEKGVTSNHQLLIKTIVSVLVFFLSFITFFSLYFWSFYPISDVEIYWRRLLWLISSPSFIGLLIFFCFVSAFMFFVSNMGRRTGSITRLISHSMGEVLQPRVVHKGFIFLDLNDSTHLAERLGSEKYAAMLRYCFKLLCDLIEIYHLEIYQFVGDEAVLTWNTSEQEGAINAILLFTAFKTRLLEKEDDFGRIAGFQPKFKCAIHCGEVVVSEVGSGQKFLAYHGDTLNTTSRMLAQCRKLEADVLVSSQALKNTHHQLIGYDYSLIKNQVFRGKNLSMDIWKVSRMVAQAAEDDCQVSDPDMLVN